MMLEGRLQNIEFASNIEAIPLLDGDVERAVRQLLGLPAHVGNGGGWDGGDGGGARFVVDCSGAVVGAIGGLVGSVGAIGAAAFCGPASGADRFRRLNAVYSRALGTFEDFHQSFPIVASEVELRERYDHEFLCNEVAWRLALLNPMLMGRLNLLQKALDAYRDEFFRFPV
ncbi:hypothetical protein DFJ73DRAFT_843098 [Zopfochytrium polystomum]|nr:hypothetical protein DFJ73DRAFT_843098 [Zopfochytrium polystomum]